MCLISVGYPMPVSITIILDITGVYPYLERFVICGVRTHVNPVLSKEPSQE